MRQLIASLKSGNWKALLACFFYFDTGFTAWVVLPSCVVWPSAAAIRRVLIAERQEALR